VFALVPFIAHYAYSTDYGHVRIVYKWPDRISSVLCNTGENFLTVARSRIPILLHSGSSIMNNQHFHTYFTKIKERLLSE